MTRCRSLWLTRFAVEREACSVAGVTTVGCFIIEWHTEILYIYDCLPAWPNGYVAHLSYSQLVGAGLIPGQTSARLRLSHWLHCRRFRDKPQRKSLNHVTLSSRWGLTAIKRTRELSWYFPVRRDELFRRLWFIINRHCVVMQSRISNDFVSSQYDRRRSASGTLAHLGYLLE